MNSETQPDIVRLKRPLEHPESIVHGFCTQCNVHVELSKEQVEELLGEGTPEDLKEYYMSMDMCGVCGADATRGSLKPIPSQ